MYSRLSPHLPLIAVALAAIVAAAATIADEARPQPRPELTPAEVTRIQLEALRTNTRTDEGIDLTYRFASPANRRTTGPLSRFVRMLRSPPYDRLLNHRAVRYGPLEVDDDTAYQPVVVTDSAGAQVAYVWVLTRQRDGEYEGCWMTDAVISSDVPADLQLAVATGDTTSDHDNTPRPGNGTPTVRLRHASSAG